MKIMKQTSRLNLRKFSFSHRVVDDRNSLPRKVVEAIDVEHFIAELEEAWKLWKDIRFLHTALLASETSLSDLNVTRRVP